MSQCCSEYRLLWGVIDANSTPLICFSLTSKLPSWVAESCSTISMHPQELFLQPPCRDIRSQWALNLGMWMLTLKFSCSFCDTTEITRENNLHYWGITKLRFLCHMAWYEMLLTNDHQSSRNAPLVWNHQQAPALCPSSFSFSSLSGHRLWVWGPLCHCRASWF